MIVRDISWIGMRDMDIVQLEGGILLALLILRQRPKLHTVFQFP